MFDRSLYLVDTPKAVIDLIESFNTADDMDEDEWGDDVADALTAAQGYAADGADEHIQEMVAEAADAWNEEGDFTGTITALETAFQVRT